MKRLLSMILALVMLSAVGPACAETAVVTAGTPVACTFASYQVYFDAMAANGNVILTWEENAEKENGYTVYTGKTADGFMTVKAYFTDDGFVYSECFGEMTIDPNDTAMAEQFGTWFGAAAGASVMSLQMLEGGYTDNLMAQYSSDIMSLVNAVAGENGENLLKGASGTGTVLGYPVRMDTNSTQDGSNFNLTLVFITASKDGKIE